MDVVDRLADLVLSQVEDRGRVLVGLDGPDAAGKTTLADRLSEAMPPRQVAVIRSSVDHFHNPAELRHRRGLLSPEGYYEDSFDYDTLRGQLLQPFRDGDARVLLRGFDYRSGVAERVWQDDVPPRAVLVFDGVFLLRAETKPYWSVSIYLSVPPEVSLQRAQKRDVEYLGSVEEVNRRYRGRYLPGQELYRRSADPEGSADVVVDNVDPAAPVVVRWAAAPGSSGRGR